MRRFTFIGDPKAPGQDPGAIRYRGLDFALDGEAVPVPDEMAERLAGHSHFAKVVPGEGDGAEPVFVIAPVEPIHKKRGRPRKA